MIHGPNIEIVRQNDVNVVNLLNEEILDEAIIAEITDSLFAFVVENPAANILLNFSKVKHLSSSALGMLIRLNKHISETKGNLKLCSIAPSLLEIFVITRLNNVFEIYEQQTEALTSF
ncbi:MAG: STAS domain-containing protein [Phycisphaerae bacterium]|nr:STAS domain-containing protein [Phycisphaerae bacterium]